MTDQWENINELPLSNGHQWSINKTKNDNDKYNTVSEEITANLHGRKKYIFQDISHMGSYII